MAMKPKLSSPLTSRMMNQVLSCSSEVLITAPIQATNWAITAPIMARRPTTASRIRAQPPGVDWTPTTSAPSMMKLPFAYAIPPAVTSRMSPPASATRLPTNVLVIVDFDTAPTSIVRCYVSPRATTGQTQTGRDLRHTPPSDAERCGGAAHGGRRLDHTPDVDEGDDLGEAERGPAKSGKSRRASRR